MFSQALKRWATLISKVFPPIQSSGLTLWSLGLFFLDVFFFSFDFDVLVPNIEAQAVKDTHVLIGDPDQRKEGYQVTAPVLVQQLVAGDHEEEKSDVVAETIFAGEKVEEFSGGEAGGLLALLLTIFAGLAENFLVGDGPGDRGDGNC